MKIDECRYSFRAISEIPTADYPVECPECGAIRTLKRYSNGPNMFPQHNMLEGTARTRKRWKLVNGKWSVTE